MGGVVGIFVTDGQNNWESSIIRGALAFHGIPSEVRSLSDINKVNDDGPCVLMAPSQQYRLDVSSLRPRKHAVILAGHYITLQYLHEAQPLSSNAILIYGEPYATIPDLILNDRFFEESRGSALLGRLYDPREYTAPPWALRATSRLLMTSVGCVRRCGYCTYGSMNSQLYPQKFTRRSRPWQGMRAELLACMERGIDCIQMTASQFLSEKPEENVELSLLAANWKPETDGRPLVAFTVSPIEVLKNRRILEDMSRSFRLYPTLSIDSFDNDTLALFDRDYTATAAIDALRILTGLRLSLKVNYIFIRPRADVNRVKGELEYFKILAAETSYLSSYDRLLLAYDSFSKSLLVTRGAPIAGIKGIQQNYESVLPGELLRLVSTIQDSLKAQIDRFDPEKSDDPLMSLIKVIEEEVSRA